MNFESHMKKMEVEGASKNGEWTLKRKDAGEDDRMRKEARRSNPRWHRRRP